MPPTSPGRRMAAVLAIVAVGSLDIAMADFDITPPSARRVLSIDDAGVAELQLRLTRG